MSPRAHWRGVPLVIAVLLILAQATLATATQTTPTPRPDSAAGKEGAKGTTGVQSLLSGQTISSAGPLTRVFISTDLNCAVNHRDDVDPEFYGDTACATLLAVDGVLYGPDVIPAGNVTEVPFTPVSQTPVTGTGTEADPFSIVTVVDAVGSGLRISETDSYVVGREYYRTEVEVENAGPSAVSAILYRAGDCYLQNSDFGFGRADPAIGSVACQASDDGGVTPGSRVEEWIPLTPDSRYMEAHYSEIWTHIAGKTSFPNTTRASEYIDNGAGLSWEFSVPAASSATYAHTTVFSPLLATSQQCGSATLDDSTDPSIDHGVIVRYDSRFIVPPNEPDAEATARLIAEAIRDRADRALSQYEGLEFPVSEDVVIEIVCEIVPVVPAWDFLPNIVPPETTGFTESATKVKLPSWFVQREFKPIVDSGFGLPGWNKPPQYWANVVDHEMFHTVQYQLALAAPNFWVNFLAAGNTTIYESSAMLGQDLIDDADDESDPDPQSGADHYDGTYIEEVKAFFDANPTIDGFESVFELGPNRYQAGAVLQYLGERFGDERPTLETKVATFTKRVLGPLYVRVGALQQAINNNPLGIGGYDVYDALRDFQIAAYSLDASNVTPTENRQYQILDRDIAHGELSGVGQGTAYPPLVTLSDGGAFGQTGSFTDSDRLEHASGRIYEIALPAGAQWVRVSIATQPSGGGDSRLRTALLTVDGTDVTIDPGRMLRGPEPDEPPVVSYVPVSGQDTLAAVLFASQDDSEYTLNIDVVSGPPGVAIVSPSSASPILDYGSFEIVVRPTFGSTLATGLSAADLTVTLDGTIPTRISDPQPDGDRVRVWVAPQTPLSIGFHDLTVEFDTASATEYGAVQHVEPEPGPPPPDYSETSAAGSLGELAQGQTGTVTVPVSADTATATFAIAWQGSDFDLELTAPSGRTIGETSSDPDVIVVQGSNEVTMHVMNPEAGVWELSATGIDVPTPEAVDFAAAEFDTPIRSTMVVSDVGEAGTPISVSLAVTDTRGALSGMAAAANVIDPSGTLRIFPLFDDGTHQDGRAGDGVFAAELWATDVAGMYDVTARVEATDEAGLPVARQATKTVTLGPKVDADGDGVSDTVEPRFGTTVGVADGGIDHDGDDLGLAAELANGTDPWNPDTDTGGEGDASEVGAGRDPRAASDDAEFPAVMLVVEPRDGNILAVSVATSDGSGQVRLSRLVDDEGVDLGLRPGTGATIEDGPLQPADYVYRAVVIDATGAESAPTFVGPYSPLSDATPPRTRIVVNDGTWNTNERAVSVQFSDLSEPVSDMRLAESLSGLASAGWTPFTALTSLTLADQQGEHVVYAQVRDASGLVSEPASAVIDLDTLAPISSVGALSPTYPSSPVDVPCAASDGLSGVAGVTLWWRFSADDGGTWTSWEAGPASPTSPISFDFSAGPGDYEFYTIATDIAGNEEAAPGSADAVTRFDDAAWPPSVRVNNDTGAQTQQERPAVVIAPDGAAYAIWDDMRNGNQTDVYFSRRDPATGAWGPNQKVNNDATTRAQWRAAIAVDGSNNAYAVWQDEREGNHSADANIYFAKRPAGTGTWGANLRVNNDTKGAVQTLPRIAVTGAGEAVAVWVDRRSSQWNIYSNRLPAGSSTWGANLRVTDNTSSRKDAPAVAIAPDGTVYAVWEDDRSGNWDIYWSKLTSGSSTWTANAKLSDDPGTFAQYSVAIGIDESGNVLASWLDDRVPNTEVRSRRLSAGSGTWGPSQVASDAAADLPSDLALGVAPSGDALAVWADARGTSWDIWGAEYNPTSQLWSVSRLISDDAGATHQMRPAAAVRGSDSVVLWFDARESYLGDVRASTR